MRLRRSARLVLVCQGRVLLFGVEDGIPRDPLRPTLLRFWCTPGGGLEPGEGFEDAARREAWEETGIKDPLIGPCIWLLEQELNLSSTGHILSHERYFLVPVQRFEVSLDNMFPYERLDVREARWWPFEDLLSTDEIVLPLGLVDRLAALQKGGLIDRWQPASDYAMRSGQYRSRCSRQPGRAGR